MKAAAILKMISIFVFAVMTFSGARTLAQLQDRDLGGEYVFVVYCAICHGSTGLGSPTAKPLNAGDAVALTDEEIVEVITNGRSGKGMNAWRFILSRAEIEGLMKFIRELQGEAAARRARFTTGAGDNDSASNPTQVRLGEKLFNGKARCMQCHTYQSRGGSIGPKLDTLALRLNAQQIRNAVELPSAMIADGYGGKEIVTQDGKTIIGRFRNETGDTIELLNARGDLWTTYVKDDLRSVFNAGRSLMPDDLLSSFSKDEQDALFAFLQTLK